MARKRYEGQKPYGFTLLELIIALALLAILASMAVARFVNLSEKAFEVQERTTIAALRSGVILFQAKYCLQGNCHWYGAGSGEDEDNLFKDLLDNPPPNLGGDPPNPGPGDGVHWHIERVVGSPDSCFYIWCPHAGWLANTPRNANLWRYYYSGPKAGSIINDLDYGVGAWGYGGHK